MAFRADIEIGVRGVRYLDELQNKLTQVSKTIDQVNKQNVVIRRTIAGAASAVPMGPGGSGITGASAQAAALSVERRVSEMRRADAQASLKSVKDRAIAENYIAGVINRRLQAKQQELAVEQKITSEQQKQVAASARQRASNVVLGAGFPLLFGGGPGAVLGGAAGGLVGGPGAFAAQIGLSAIGQQLDMFAASAAKVGIALSPLTADIDAIVEALGVTGTSTANYIAELQKLERQDEALAVATEEMARLVGDRGVQALRSFGEAATELSNEWARAMTQMQAALAGLLAGPLRAVVNQLESANLFRQAQASADPRIQQLIQLRNRPGILGGTGGRSVNDITAEIIELQRKANVEAQKREQIENTTEGTLTQQKRVLEAQLELAYTDGDLTNDKVFKLSQILIDKEFEVKLQQAINDKTDVELVQLDRKVKLQQLAARREQAVAAAAAKAASELERQRKEMERMAKLREQQFTQAQRGFVLAEAGLGVTMAAETGDEKSKIRAEFDKQRAERMFRYTELLEKALSDEERLTLAATQEIEAEKALIDLSKELFDVDLRRAKLLSEPTALSNAQQELEALAAKIQGKEQEYEIQKKINDLMQGGASFEEAQGLVLTIQDLEKQNKLIQSQKQLWTDIYSTIAGEIQNGIKGLIEGTATWGDVLSSILGSLGSLFVNAAFTGLGGALKLPGFADGGFVTGPTTAVIGEGGQPEYVIPQSKMSAAMSRYSRGARGESVIPGNGTSTEGGGTATAPMAPIDVRYSVERINNVDYVTADQFRAGMAQAAQQGAIQGERRAMRSLKGSAATRRSVGI